MASLPRCRPEGRARAVERRLLSQLPVKRRERGARGGERVVGCRHNAPGRCSSSARARRALDEAREEAETSVENLEEPSEDLWSKRCHLKLSKSFLPAGLAVDLREQFDRRFEDPRQGDPDRFIWDYWHVPDQYNLLRTPAKAFFSSSSYDALEEALLEYGQKELGCSKMTPLWLSCYVDGCYQGFHADNPHGPWAFVLSLTSEDGGGGAPFRKFSGGETTILKPHILEYWRAYDPSAGLESKDIFDTIAPVFNQLTAFDPRLPHAVSKVRGTQDPREGRLVLHGWFSDPSPFYEGHLEGDMVSAGAAMDSVSTAATLSLPSPKRPSLSPLSSSSSPSFLRS